jgi:hypothetical protein
VLAEAPGTGNRPSGRLGFRTAAGWYHATRVIERRRRRRAYEATLATNDPGGRSLRVRIRPAGDGVVAQLTRRAR